MEGVLRRCVDGAVLLVRVCGEWGLLLWRLARVSMEYFIRLRIRCTFGLEGWRLDIIANCS
jgi:hypothetical protein